MDKLVRAFLEFAQGSRAEESNRLDCMKLANVIEFQDGFSYENLPSLISESQCFTRALVYLSSSLKHKTSDPLIDPALDSAIMELVNVFDLNSEVRINLAIAELLKQRDLFSTVSCGANLEADVANVLLTPKAVEPSSVYSAKAPRIHGNPDPLPDEFGDWDEYRDDMDPGYRVREVYESDVEHVLLRSNDPSPILGPICFDNAELDDELAACAAVNNTPPSPVFGSAQPTLKFNYMGNSFEVERSGQPPPLIVPSHPILPLQVCSEWPLTYTPVRTGAPVTMDALMLPIVHERGRTGFQPSKEFDASNGTMVAGRYEIVGYLGSAAFSKAMKAVDQKTGDSVCLKIIKNDKDFVDQSLDEIKMLLLLKDGENVLKVLNFFYFKEHLIIVTELLCDNLYEFSRFNKQNALSPYFTMGRLQRIAHQLLHALVHVHAHGVIHCDLKPENILFKSYARCEIKLIDFGSACFQTDRLSTYIQSRSYRAPEVVLGCLPYSSQVDLWSLGCVLAELWTGFVLFQNDSTQSLLARILGIIGPIPAHMMQSGANVDQLFLQQSSLFVELEAAGVVRGKGRLVQLLVPKRTSLFQRMRIQDPEFLDFLAGLLQIDPELRLDAKSALAHPWMVSSTYSDGLDRLVAT